MRKQDTSGAWYSGIPSWAELKKMAQAGTISQVLSEGDLMLESIPLTELYMSTLSQRGWITN